MWKSVLWWGMQVRCMLDLWFPCSAQAPASSCDWPSAASKPRTSTKRPMKEIYDYAQGGFGFITLCPGQKWAFVIDCRARGASGTPKAGNFHIPEGSSGSIRNNSRYTWLISIMRRVVLVTSHIQQTQESGISITRRVVLVAPRTVHARYGLIQLSAGWF